ncbi:hypothetical protein D9757_005361 [Collybiopsis confluens]|uniref:Uncharacterized protein n=1 Tax=Collybiopsis confluens TaxID=2823264 RepID=A0A8H5HLW6_9AGAR|nr:hypothetical protein D9757_005361 [Collybiopsis confluens]
MDASPNDKPSALEKIAIGYEKGKREAEQDERARSAAIKIQQAWRQRNSRAQLQQKYFSPDLRWKDAVTHARLKVHRSSADAGKNSARDRWNRGAFFALRIRDGNDAMSPTDLTSADDEQRGEKHLEEQHWLELIDS